MGMTLAHLLTCGSICRPFPVSAQRVVDNANGDWPSLDELGINVTARLRKLIEHATEYDPDERPKDVASFKRELDNASPHVSLTLYNDGSLASPDGTWSIITAFDGKGTHAVDVRRDGLRRSGLCQKGLTDKVATRHVRTVDVKLLAEEKSDSKLI